MTKVKLTKAVRRELVALAKFYPVGSSFEVSIHKHGLVRVHVHSKGFTPRRGFSFVRTKGKTLVVA